MTGCGPEGGAARGCCFGLLDWTVGLNVTVLCGRGATGRGPVEPCDIEEISGVVSVELDAMLNPFHVGLPMLRHSRISRAIVRKA